MSQPTELENLVRDLESDRVERTQSLTDSSKFCKAICAFANDLPGHRLSGYLFVGVDRNGEPTGAKIDEKLLERLAGHRNDGQILPVPSMRVFSHSLKGRDVAVVEVMPSDMPPVRYKNIVWIRVGPSERMATPEEERRLTERRVDRARTWDLQACRDATLADLELDLFTINYLPQAVSREVLEENNRSIEDKLASLRLYHRPLAAPTNAAILLFAKDPGAFVSGAYVQYIRYNGASQSDEVLAERRISGDLLGVMRGLDTLAREIDRVRPVRQENLSEILVSDYPSVALHELLINAVIHRNYDSSTTPVAISHFNDRVEILNPGSLYGDLTREQFPHGTSYRNPVLAEGAKILGFANRFGRGIEVAREALRKNGSPPLEYTIGENHMLMIVRRRP